MSAPRESEHNPEHTDRDEILARAYAVVAAVPDPEIPIVTLADLGILRSVQRNGSAIEVTLTPTYTGCPATLPIQRDVEAALRAAGIRDARVHVILSPPWTTDDITEEGRRKLRDYGIAPPPRSSRSGALFETPVVSCPRCGSFATNRISEFGSTPCKALWRCETCREPFDVFKCL
ncbi:MAG: 1,2-phenylacetyl-CoA epoxidase subunit PaaD [Hyphomicrobiaceae bacterium]